MSLQKRTVKAAIVLVVGHGGAQIIRFAGSLITTRILAPELFGVMAIANSIAIMATLFSDLGFRMSVVRSERGEDPQFLKTIFSFKVLQGVFLFALILMMALLLWWLSNQGMLDPTSTYSNSDLPVALLIIAFSPLIMGLRSIQFEVFIRKQEVVGQTLLQLIAQILSLAFVIGVALYKPSIYALAFANVVAALVTVIGSYIIYSWDKFGFAWDRSAVHEILSFGKWVFSSTVLSGLANNLDKFLLGYFLNSVQMGVYSIAWMIFSAYGAVFNKLTEPLFSAVSEVIRENPANIKKVYYKIRFYRDWITCIPVCLVIVNGDLLISIIYDERYKDAGLFLQLLSVSYLIECFLLKNQVITAMGNSRIQFHLSAWRLLGLCLLVPVGNYAYGVIGIVCAVAVRQAFGAWELFAIFKEKKILSWRRELLTFIIIVVSLALGYLVRVLLLYLMGLYDL